ncbi:MAG: hypothetical protein IPJ85_17575 [Flavobacteriales bacterium]|nr:hypothetical protein [Flavobacteriales bacterium]
MNVLKQVALAADSDSDAFNWLLANGHRDLAMLSHKMHAVKQTIEDDNNDPHKYK